MNSEFPLAERVRISYDPKLYNRKIWNIRLLNDQLRAEPPKADEVMGRIHDAIAKPGSKSRRRA